MGKVLRGNLNFDDTQHIYLYISGILMLFSHFSVGERLSRLPHVDNNDSRKKPTLLEKDEKPLH